jgi:hypothetical protein
MSFKERVRRAHNMTVPLSQEVVEDAIILYNPATDAYIHSSKEGRLPLVKKDGEYYYEDGSPLRTLRKYIVQVNPEAEP